MPRVAAIAIDAAEWSYLEPRLAAGALPNLARLRARSASFQLRSPMAYRSETVWARFLTGREPFEFGEWPTCVGFDPSDYSLRSNLATAVEPFFALGPDVKVIALDLIHSRPSASVSGVQVVGWGSHSPRWPRSSVPAGLLSEIDERFGTNPTFGNDFDYGWYDEDFLEAILKANRIGLDRRVDIARWLLDQNPDWDLFLTCFSEFHSVGHQAWHGADAAHPLHGESVARTAERCQQEITEAVDDAVGRLLDALPDDCAVVVFAMHGFRPADDLVATVLLPELFHRLEHGRRLLRDPDQDAWRAAGQPPVLLQPGEFWGEYMADRFVATPAQRARLLARRALPGSAFNLLRRLMGKAQTRPLAEMGKATPAECLEATTELLEQMAAGPYYEVAGWYRPFWPSMRAFVLPGFADGHIRVNLQGRERDGIVHPDDYEKVLDEVVATVAACRDARTGASILADVERPRAADPLDPSASSDDLLLFFDGASDAIEHPDAGLIGPFPHQRTAAHSPDGFAFVAGPGIEPGARGARDTADLSATVLELLGQGHARQVSGSPLVTRS